MEIITKLIEETTIKVPFEEEDHAVAFLKNLEYHIVNFDHHEDYVKVVGQRIFEVKRGKHGSKKLGN